MYLSIHLAVQREPRHFRLLDVLSPLHGNYILMHRRHSET